LINTIGNESKSKKQQMETRRLWSAGFHNEGKRNMKNGILLSVLGIWLATMCAGAQETSSKRALAEELLTLMNTQENIEKTFAMVKQMMPAQMEKMKQATGQTNMPANASAQAGKVMETMLQELSWDKMKEDYITLYADTFTEEELKGIIAFYKSPAGQAFVQKQPELMKRSMELSQKLMLKVMPAIQGAAMNPNEAAPAPAVKQKESK
jgi:hypothetical protein